MTEQLTLTCASKADLLADLAGHFGALGLTLPDFTFSLPDHPSGIAEAVMDDGARVLISVQEQPAPRPLAADFAIEGPNAWLWRARFDVPQSSAATTVIPATRGDLEVPATARETGTIRPHTPSHVFSGIEPLPPIEGEDFEAPEEWEQLTPGVPTDYPFSPNGYPLGWVVTRNGVRYRQDGDLPTGNFFVPGEVGSLWYAVTGGEGYDPWDAGTTYSAGARVTDEGEDWLNRDASNTGRKPGSTAAGWLQISNRPYPYYYLGNAGYPVTVDGEPMQVTDTGRLWQVTQDGAGSSSFPPSVVGTGWQDVGPAP